MASYYLIILAIFVSVPCVLSDASTGLVDLTLRNRVQIIAILEILAKRRQYLLGDAPSLEIVESLRFETQLDSSLVDQPAP